MGRTLPAAFEAGYELGDISREEPVSSHYLERVLLGDVR
jgi:hypothetical protein